MIIIIIIIIEKGEGGKRSKHLHVNHSPNIQENNGNKKRPNKRDIMME